MAQFLVFAAMLVIDDQLWLAHQRISSPNDAIENIEVTAPGKGSTCIERVVKSADLLERGTTKHHVRARAEESCTYGISRRFRQHVRKAHAIETLAEPTHALENDLRRRVEF